MRDQQSIAYIFIFYNFQKKARLQYWLWILLVVTRSHRLDHNRVENIDILKKIRKKLKTIWA